MASTSAPHRIAIQRSQGAVCSEGVVAAIQQALHGTHLVDDPPLLVTAMQGGAEHVIGLERDHVDERGGIPGLGMDQTGFGAGHEQGRLCGIALRGVPTLFDHELGVVAQHSGAQALHQGGMGGGIDRFPPLSDLSGGIVAPAGDFVDPAPGADFLHGHLVFGQGAGFVGADHGGAAERFHGGELPDDGAPPRHAVHADGQHDRHRGWQPLGDGSHGERHGRHEHVHGGLSPADAHGKGHRRQKKDDPQQQPAELGNFLGERCGDVDRLGDEPGDASGLSLVAGGPDEAFGLAGRDEGAGVGLVLPIGQSEVVIERVGVFRHRQGLPGQGRFVAVEIPHVEESQVRGYPVTRLEQHHIAGHQIGRGEPELPAAAPDRGLGAHQTPQRLDGLLRFAFL
jgi:hypothetical protein